MPEISAADPHPRKRIAAADTEIAYVDTGDSAAGRDIVFLHGNPTSSYLWRNVIPHVADRGRCLAPDLAGMGESGPSSSGYRFADHARCLDAWFDAVDARNAVLVVHDWGSALGFHWARRNPGRVAGIAYMEALVRPVTWDEWPAPARKFFQSLRSPDGEKMVLERNLFVERLLPASVIRGLDEAEMEVYRRPFREPGESRRPTLAWPREIPVGGEPADVVALAEEWAAWMAATPTPKLFIDANPGTILVGAQREFCRSWPNQTEVAVAGTHFIQEDSPHEIGAALAAFVDGLAP